MEVYKSKYLKIIYYKNIGRLEIHWQSASNMTDALFCDEAKIIEKFIDKYRPIGFLANSEDFNYNISPELNDWFNENIINKINDVLKEKHYYR